MELVCLLSPWKLQPLVVRRALRSRRKQMDETDSLQKRGSGWRERLRQEGEEEEEEEGNGKCTGMTSPDDSYSCPVTMGNGRMMMSLCVYVPPCSGLASSRYNKRITFSPWYQKVIHRRISTCEFILNQITQTLPPPLSRSVWVLVARCKLMAC